LSFITASRPFFIASSVCLALAVALTPAASSAQEESQPYTLACGGGWSLDLQSNRSVCRQVSITNGSVRISADESTASETNFDNSEWQLDGNIRFTFDTTSMEADHASFRFVRNEAVYTELSGAPVVLEDFLAEENVEIRATAEKVSYDKEAGTARLVGEATLRRGDREFLACDVTYNFKDKRWDSQSSACGGVRMIIPGRQGAPAGGSSEGS
jgi:lipopolysaccharide transport protein LptA